MTRLFKGGLSWDTTDETLRNVFSEFDQVTECAITRDRDTGRSRGMGFVVYSTEEEAQSAIERMDGREIDGRRIKVDMTTSRGGHS